MLEDRPTKMRTAVKIVRNILSARSTNEAAEIVQQTNGISSGVSGEENRTSTKATIFDTSTTKATSILRSPDLPPSELDAQLTTSNMELDCPVRPSLETLTNNENTTLKVNTETKFSEKVRRSNNKQEATPSWIYNIGEREYHRGLTNIGNTCWLNCILQSLIRCQYFLETFLKPRNGNALSLIGASILWFIRNMTATMPKDIEEVFNPQPLYNVLAQIPNCEVLLSKLQQDPTEMLFWFLQYMSTYPQKKSEDNKSTWGHNDTVLKEISALFTGKLRQNTWCSQCENSTSREVAFTLLPTSLGPAPEIQKNTSPNGKKARIRTVSIEELLRRFSHPELLDDENKFECTTCSEKVLAAKYHTITSPPRLLLLHIKRLTFSKDGGISAKRNDHVRFNRVLQLEKTSLTKTGSPSYKLKGVIVHKGDNSTSGHYIAYVLHGNGWLKCSDHKVCKVQWDTVKANQAYLLIYELIDQSDIPIPPQSEKIKNSQTFPLLPQASDTNHGKPKKKGYRTGLYSTQPRKRRRKRRSERSPGENEANEDEKEPTW